MLVAPAERLGVFKVWLFTDARQLVAVHIEVPRVVYVNSYTDKKNSDDTYKAVRKRLPRDKRSHFLYEVTLAEEEYRATYNDFDYFVTNPRYIVNHLFIHSFFLQIGH